MDLNNKKEYLIYLLKGFVMGASDIVPGVSGGTMALIPLLYGLFSLVWFQLLFFL
jgi:uncharacterized membrane protein